MSIPEAEYGISHKYHGHSYYEAPKMFLEFHKYKFLTKEDSFEILMEDISHEILHHALEFLEDTKTSLQLDAITLEPFFRPELHQKCVKHDYTEIRNEKLSMIDLEGDEE